MKKEEGISWILDRPASEWQELRRKYPDRKEYIKHYHAHSDEKYRRNIEFVHSLGLKCDCVGWSYLDLARPDVGEILDKIEAFCRKEGWLARGGYGCRYTDMESDWYEIDAPYINEVEGSRDQFLYNIRAYKNKNQPFFLGWCDRIPAVVSEKFREVCLRHNIPDIRFCWVKDVGRYDSIQYAFMFPANRVTRIACDRYLRYSEDESHKGGELDRPHGPGSELYGRLEQLGGWLPRLAEIFYNFQFNLPDYYRVEDLPETGFAFVKGGRGYCVRQKLLVHKNTAEILVREKVLDPKFLQPALLYSGDVPPGYSEQAMTKENERMVYDPAHAAEMELEYQKIKQLVRPKRKATEKQTASALRAAKRDRKEDFGKKMRKEIAESLTDTPYAPLIPYYLVADGGSLCDEYEFLPHKEALEMSREYEEDMAREELTDTPTGVVFCKCADGDKVILTPLGTVVRMSHEVPEAIEEWPTPAQFITDALEMEE